MQLKFGENVIPESNNEVITLERLEASFKITSNATNIDSLNMDQRTFILDFNEKVHFLDLPPMAVFYVLSNENSFGVERSEFFHGKKEVAQILLNHHTKMSYKMKRRELLKEKHTDCNEETFWEVIDKKWHPKIVQNCPNPCYPFTLPSGQLPRCSYADWSAADNSTQTSMDDHEGYKDFDVEDKTCAYDVFYKMIEEEDFYNFKSCSIEEYEGRVLDDHIIPGKSEFWYWAESDKQDWEIVVPESEYHDNPGNLTIKFSYTFDLPQTMIVSVENYIVTFFDLIGIVGGTLGMFIGFAFYDNILALVEYLILIVNWAKRISGMKKASKVSDVKKSSEAETPKEEVPKEEIPNEETPKEVTPKEESTKEETPKEEAHKEETPKEEVPKEESPKEETPKEESTKESQVAQA